MHVQLTGLFSHPHEYFVSKGEVQALEEIQSIGKLNRWRELEECKSS